MKNFIKLSILVLLLSFGTDSFAQSFGIKAGLNLSNLLVKDDYDTYSDDFKMNPGFHFGPTIEFPMNEMLSFESGLLLSTKGTKMSEKESFDGYSYEYTSKINLLYLDIPLTAKATFDIGNSKAYGILGPYVGIGLSGKSKSEYTEDGETDTEEEDLSFGSDENEDDLKSLDYGLTAGIGIELNSIQIGVTYNLGLANISIDTEDSYKINNRVLGISVGYKFGGN
jgi:hypothetical protein